MRPARTLLMLVLASAPALARADSLGPGPKPPVRGAAPAPSPAPKDAAAARAELLKRLLALADWCNQSELFLQRDGTWRAVLVLDPDSADARRGLRFARNADGSWKEPAPREVKDRNAKALPEFQKRRGEAVAAYRDALLALLEDEHADAARRSAVHAEILALDPEDAVVHGLRGEVRVDAGWVLAESAAGKARRAEVKELVQKGRAAKVDAQVETANEADLALLPAWKCVLSAEGARVAAQSSEAEARELLQAVHATRELARGIFGTELSLPGGFSVYLVSEAADRDKFQAALTDATDDERKSWKDSAGVGLPHRDAVVLWHKDAKKRLDCFTRHVVAKLLRTGFGIEARQGWAFEGLGLYLTRELVGTRLTWFILGQAGGAADAQRAKLLAPESNWMAEAQKILKGATPPKLAELLAKDLSALKLEDMVIAYAFSAFLAEGLGHELPEILQRVGKGEAADTAIAAVTGRPFAEVETRFARWLEERR